MFPPGHYSGSASRSTGDRACTRTHKLDDVLGEREALVVELKPFGLHGVTYYDVTVQFSDRTLEHARLGPEAVPDALQPGERVMATLAANMLVSLRRP